MLPSSAIAKKLEQYHPDYLYYKDTWQTIADLREGATAITRNVRRYCPKRPGETEDIYELRCQKLAYTPVMSNAIREFVSKLAGSPLFISGENDAFWQLWRSQTDGGNCAEGELVTKLFSSLLYFKKAYVGIDRPRLGVVPRSLAETERLPNSPYAVVYEPLDVPNWGDGWVMTRQFKWVSQPLKELSQTCRWTFWTSQETVAYEATVRPLGTSWDTLGQIGEILTPEGWYMIDSPKAIVKEVARTVHGLGRCPLVVAELPDELWTAGNVYLKQLQHTRIESSWTEAGAIAGSIQRIYTPSPPPPMDDPRFTYEASDYSELAKANNAHILIGSNFEFKESTGQAITSLTSQLDKIEGQIKDLVSMRFASVSTGTLEQSGKSKQVDMSLLEDAMKAYGSRVLQMYQDILDVVADLVKLPRVTSYGLDSYSTDTLDQMLEQSEKVLGLPWIPRTALKVWASKLATLMTGTISPDGEEKLQQELDQIFSPTSDTTMTP